MSSSMLKLLWITLIWITPGIQGLPKVFRTNEICGVYNGHRVYLELGDRGQLQATNVTFERVRFFHFLGEFFLRAVSSD